MSNILFLKSSLSYLKYQFKLQLAQTSACNKIKAGCKLPRIPDNKSPHQLGRAESNRLPSEICFLLSLKKCSTWYAHMKAQESCGHPKSFHVLHFFKEVVDLHVYNFFEENYTANRKQYCR